MEPLTFIFGGTGLAGIAAVLGTLFLSRSQRDLNLANAAGRLVDASDVLTTNLQEDLTAARAEVAAARAEIAVLSERVYQLTETIGAAESRAIRAEADRDACLAQLEALRARHGGRRQGDDQ
jgi:predicted dinucleotide-binding enzyme